MKILLILQLYLLHSTSALSFSSQLPSFNWLDGTDPRLKIGFPDGGHDVIRFHKVQRFDDDVHDCIMMGGFEQEPDVSVTLTGGCVNSKDFEMTIVGSERLDHATFQITNGIAHPAGHGSVAFDDVVRSPRPSFREQPAKPTSRDNLPYHIWLPIEMYADIDFRKAFGSDTQVQRVINKIVGHAQAWFSHKNLKPEIILQPSFPDGWKYPRAMSMNLKKELKTGSDYVAKLRNKDTPVGQFWDSFQDRVSVFLGIQTLFQGLHGIAQFAAVCDIWYANRVSAVVEHWRYISITAEVLAHELAHSIGISHDFDDDTTYYPYLVRYLRDKSGKSCYTKGSVMDNGTGKNKWSKCSIEFLETAISKNHLSCLNMTFKSS